MAQRYPQPPGDSGTRKNLQNRKAKVDRAEKAYVGIVNVYSLIPKGGGAVKIEEFNIPPAPPGSIIYPQSRPKKISNKKLEDEVRELRKAEGLRLSKSKETFKLERNSHAKRNQLRKYIGNTEGDWIDDIGVYEQWLMDHKGKNNQYGYTLDSPPVKNALKELRKRQNTKSFEPTLNRQAMNLSVSRDKLMQWYNASVLNLDKVVNTANKFERQQKAHEEAVKKMEEEGIKNISRLPDIIEIPERPKVIQAPVQLPIPENKPLRKISFSESMNRNKYIPLGPGQVEQAYRADPNQVVAVQDNDKISYFADISNLSLERKRKIVKMNMKRPRYVFRIKRKTDKVVKRKIIKCNCRRKK